MADSFAKLKDSPVDIFVGLLIICFKEKILLLSAGQDMVDRSRFFKEITKREFLNQTGKAALALGGSTVLDLLLGCAASPRETRQDVAQINWDCNPILPIPPVGCYTGTNNQGSYTHPGNERWVIDSFHELYGLAPAFNAIGIGTWGAANAHFPQETCKVAIDRGTIPIIRYVTLPVGYRPVIEGKFDDYFKKFANQAAEFGHPIILLPWQCANEPSGRIWAWSGPPAGQYVEAWIRMHNIFQKEGANKNVIWSTKLICGGWPGWEQFDPLKYIPPKEYVDIIGWNCSANLEVVQRYRIQADLSFDAQFRRDYNRAASRYPTKPQMLWELGASTGPDQARWLDDTLGKIQTHYPRVKGVMFDVMANAGYDPSHTPETVKVIRKHFASGCFIGSAIKK